MPAVTIMSLKLNEISIGSIMLDFIDTAYRLLDRQYDLRAC
jgi:hypothetical protein